MDHVAQPLNFPDAVIHQGGVRKSEVSVDGKVEVKLCLHSPQNNVYEVDRKITDCIFGQVHIGYELLPTDQDEIYTRSDRQVVIKIIRRQSITELGPNGAEDPMKEFAALQYVGNDHPHVMGQIECIADENNYYSVMDYAKGGELFVDVQTAGRYSEDVCRRYLLDIISGLEYLHGLGVYHRGLSLEDIVLTGEGRCKIIDFGMCLLVPRDDEGKFQPIAQVPRSGKMSYLPPEVFLQASPALNGDAADVWSLGCILATMLIGGQLFSQPSNACKRFRQFFQGEFRAMLTNWKINLSEEAIDLIEKILVINPAERPSLAAIRQHPWFNLVG